MSTTATDIATWMIDIITAEGKVTQEDMVDAIEAKFGADWVYVNDNGHTSIDRAVLKEFRKAHDGGIKWHREERAWYIGDEPEAEAESSESPAPDSL